MLYWHQSQAIGVSENDRYRWLTINNTVQSVMNRQTPWQPVLPHVHAMALSLFAAPDARHIMELGLGGGALARLTPHTHPEASFTSVEINTEVIQCFQRFFNPDDSNVDIIQTDACEQLTRAKGLDLLFVDIFLSSRLPGAMEHADFYQSCLSALKADGVLCLNLLPQNALLVRNVKKLLVELTGHHPWLFKVPGYRNAVFVAGKNALGNITDQALDLKQFAVRHRLDLSLIEPVL